MQAPITTATHRKRWRTPFDSAFGRFFEHVRLYHGAAIDRLLAAWRVLALTVSPDTVWLSTSFLQASGHFKALILDHALAHTFQLGNGGNDPQNQLEAEAWRAADEITNWGRTIFAATDNREAIREWKSTHLIAGGGRHARR